MQLPYVAFNQSGSRLITSGHDYGISLWQTDTSELLALVCATLSRNLSQAEWTDYLGDRPYRKTCPDLP
jgi:hypothetical protein